MAVAIRDDGGTRQGERHRDPSLWTVTAVEWFRIRRGFGWWYALLVPVVLTMPLYVMALASPEGRSGGAWRAFRDVALEGWGILVPMSAALLAALSVRADQDAWRLVLSYPLPRGRLLVGKFLALALLALTSSVVLAALLCGAAALHGRLGDSAATVVSACLLPWFAGLASSALTLVVATTWGLGPTIAVGVLGMMNGALIADKSWWFFFPFAWPMRVILPLAAIGPNGVPLPPTSHLRDHGVIVPALVLSAALTLALLPCGVAVLRRKEV